MDIILKTRAKEHVVTFWNRIQDYRKVWKETYTLKNIAGRVWDSPSKTIVEKSILLGMDSARYLLAFFIICNVTFRIRVHKNYNKVTNALIKKI